MTRSRLIAVMISGTAYPQDWNKVRDISQLGVSYASKSSWVYPKPSTQADHHACQRAAFRVSEVFQPLPSNFSAHQIYCRRLELFIASCRYAHFIRYPRFWLTVVKHQLQELCTVNQINKKVPSAKDLKEELSNPVFSRCRRMGHRRWF